MPSHTARRIIKYLADVRCCPTATFVENGNQIVDHVYADDIDAALDAEGMTYETEPLKTYQGGPEVPER